MSLSDDFFREITLEEESLTVRFNPADWLRKLDLSAYVERSSCTTDGPSIVCDGTQEYLCEGEVVMSQRECGDLDQICLPTQGCADRLKLMPESQQYRSIRNALFSGVRPTFIWGD